MWHPRPPRAVLFSVASLAVVCLTAGFAPAQAGAPADGGGGVTFAAVEAIFARACVHCHGGDSPVEGLALDTHAGILKGSARGAVVVPGQPDRSALVGRLLGTIQPQMPFDGDPLPASEIRIVEEWIRTGARGTEPVPAPGSAPAAPAAPAPPDAPGAPAPAGGAPVPAGPAGPAGSPVPAPAAATPGPVTWSQVAPILRANCVRCHQPKGIRGPAPEGLRFDTYPATVGGAERSSVVPGRADASPLLRAVRGQARARMPLGAPPLKTEAIALLERWIREGARGDDGGAAPIPAGREVRLFGVFDGATRVDGVPFTIDGGTLTEGRPAQGSTVEVRATVLGDGALRATRIRPRAAADGLDDGVAPPTGDDHGGRGGHGGGDDRGGHGGRGGR